MADIVPITTTVEWQYLTTKAGAVIPGLSEVFLGWKKVSRVQRREKNQYLVWLDDGVEASFALEEKDILFYANFSRRIVLEQGVDLRPMKEEVWFHEIRMVVRNLFETEKQRISDWDAVREHLSTWLDSNYASPAESRFTELFVVNDDGERELKKISYPLQAEDLGYVLSQMQSSEKLRPMPTDRITSYILDGKLYFLLNPFVSYVNSHHGGLRNAQVTDSFLSHNWGPVQVQKWHAGKNISVRVWTGNMADLA